MNIIIVSLLCAAKSIVAEIVPEFLEGKASLSYEVSFIVSLRKQNSEIFGVGSLVTLYDVITSAKCIEEYVDKKENIPRYAGIFAIAGTAMLTGRRHEIGNLHIEKKTLVNLDSGNNIGIVTLESEISTKYTTTALLQITEPNSLNVQNITLFGWSDDTDFRNHANSQTYPGSLKRIRLKITSSGRLWPHSRKRPPNENIFWGLPYSSEDSITDIDVGSPVVVNNAIVIGILSYVTSSISATNPAFFTKVHPFVTYIQDAIDEIVNSTKEDRKRSEERPVSWFKRDTRRIQSFTTTRCLP